MTAGKENRGAVAGAGEGAASTNQMHSGTSGDRRFCPAPLEKSLMYLEMGPEGPGSPWRMLVNMPLT